MTDYRNIQGADGGDPNRYLELLSADFDKKVSDLQQRLKDAMDALKDDAQARYDLAVSKADADYKVAVEKCAGLAAGGDACKTAAKADAETVKQRAKLELDNAKAAANGGH